MSSSFLGGLGSRKSRIPLKPGAVIARLFVEVISSESRWVDFLGLPILSKRAKFFHVNRARFVRGGSASCRYLVAVVFVSVYSGGLLFLYVSVRFVHGDDKLQCEGG